MLFTLPLFQMFILRVFVIYIIIAISCMILRQMWQVYEGCMGAYASLAGRCVANRRRAAYDVTVDALLIGWTKSRDSECKALLRWALWREDKRYFFVTPVHITNLY